MNKSQVFPSRFWRPADVGSNGLTGTIADVTLEQMVDGQQKAVLSFEQGDKSLILNRVNFDTIEAAYGPETDDWIGKKLTMFVVNVDFKGKQVPAIRVRIPASPAKAQAKVTKAQAFQPAPSQDEAAEDAPF